MLYKDINRNICTYLLPIDIVHYHWVNWNMIKEMDKSLLGIIKEQLTLKIFQRLNDVLDNSKLCKDKNFYEFKPRCYRMKIIQKFEFKTFLKIMEESGTILTGSFFLQCFYGEDWNSDIDFFSISKIGRPFSFNIMCNYLYNITRWNFGTNKLKNIVKNYEQKYRDLIGFNHDYVEFKKINKIKTIKNYSNCQFKRDVRENEYIQVISLDESIRYIEDVKNFIDTNFDLTICMNKFYIKENKPQIEFKNLTELFNRESNITLGFTNNINSRILKYKNRGFKIQEKK